MNERSNALQLCPTILVIPLMATNSQKSVSTSNSLRQLRTCSFVIPVSSVTFNGILLPGRIYS